MLTEVEFWNKVDASGDCWEWIGGGNGNGYGRCLFDKRQQYAHRVAYGLLVGEIPNGLELDHLCRNRACVNPDHLEPVTRMVNVERGARFKDIPRKTHCPHGHPYSGRNLYLDPNGWQQCKACHARRESERRLNKQGIPS